MRRVPLNFFEDAGDFVEGIRSSSKATIAPMIQGDTIEFAITKLVKPDPGIVTLDAFVVKPWSFTSIRVSIGYVDKAPEAGDFKLAVAGVKTTKLTWPADLSTPALIAAWKATVLAAVNVVAGTGAARLDDPPNTPAHLFYFTWTGAADARVITVEELALVPPIDVDYSVQNLQAAPAYQQLVKLTRLPIVMATAFAFPLPPIPAISAERAGGTGVNAVQLISIPNGAAGAFDLAWNGSSTRPIAVTGVTAATIATALNEIVPAGSSNPSFRVEARTTYANTGLKFAVEFIGPLAAASQSLLIASARDQTPLTTALGTLLLRRSAFERVLNGAASLTLSLEVVITDAGGESTILRDITLLNDMTESGTVASVAQAAGIIVTTETVYVNAGLGTSFAEAAAGASFRPTAAGNALVINHALGTWRPRCNVTLLEVNHTAYAAALAANPGDVDAALATTGVITGSHPIEETEFSEHRDSSNQVTLTLPWSLVNDSSSDLDYRLLKADVASPDSTLQVFTHAHTWDNVRDTLPSGQTIRAKIAALEAAIGILAGSLNIDASHITGLLKSAQIDLTNLAQALKTTAAFLDTIRELVKDPTVIDNIATGLAASTKFLATLIAVATSPAFLEKFVPGLLADPTFEAALSAKIFSALAGGSSLPDGTISSFVADFAAAIPAPIALFTIGSKVIEIFAELPFARPALTAGATVTGDLSPTPVATVHQVVGSASCADFGGRKGREFVNGAYVVNPAGFWYEVTNYGAGSNWWPVEMDLTLFESGKTDGDFYAGSQWLLAVPYQLSLQGGQSGRILTVLETGVEVIEQTTQLVSITWSAVKTMTIPLNAATPYRKLSYRATRAANGTTFLAWVNTGLIEESATAPTSAMRRVRLRTERFDLTNPAAGFIPKGSFTLNMAGVRDIITPL